MPFRRIYISNDSYPEMREVRSGGRRKLWWRTFYAALRVRRFWVFAVTMLAIEGAVAIAAWTVPRWAGVHITNEHLWHVGFVLLGGFIWMMLSLSWGGDIMRDVMRRCDERAGRSCPSCGQDLSGSPIVDDHVACPECGDAIPRSAIEVPNRVPTKYLAFSWRRA